MTKTTDVVISRDGILTGRGLGTLTVMIEGRVVWWMQPDRDGEPLPEGQHMTPWPRSLLPYLHGRGTVEVVDFASEETLATTDIVFTPDSGRVRIVDPKGRPLMVNKVGTMSRAMSEASGDIRHEILVGTVRILDDLRGPGNVAAFLNYGALLGAVRTGKLIGHDCDTDLCYLSDKDNPADIILESIRLERTMRDLGWGTVRMSSGDFKVKLPLSDGRVEAVDVFAAFHISGRFYQLGNRSGEFAREDIVPTGTIDLEGVEFPVPRNPERMMEFLYGESWRVPDPAFNYEDPVDGMRRLDGWLRGFRTEQPKWNRFYESELHDLIPQGGSDFAQWVLPRLEGATTVADMACGNGRDSVFFAKNGLEVRSFDCSPRARLLTTRLLRRHGLPRDVRSMQLNEMRRLLSEGLELHGTPIYARQILECVDGVARENLFRLASVAESHLFVEFASNPGVYPDPNPDLSGRHDPDAMVELAIARGGHLIERTDGPGTDMFDRPDPSVTRLHLDFTKEK